MAYDDGFYYGQCKIICEAETIAYNGKTVTVTSGSFSKSGVIANKLFECIVPGRGQYTISVLDGGTTLWSGTVEAGYGECIHQMLADGYEAIIEKSKLTLAEIEAAPGSVADYVPDADAVKTLNSNLTANSNSFIFDYHDGVYGWNESAERGADTFHPFSTIATTGEGWLRSMMDAWYSENVHGKPYFLSAGRYIAWGLDFSNISSITFYLYSQTGNNTIKLTDYATESVGFNQTSDAKSYTDLVADISSYNTQIDMAIFVASDASFHRVFVKSYTRTDGTVVTADWA